MISHNIICGRDKAVKVVTSAIRAEKWRRWWIKEITPTWNFTSSMLPTFVLQLEVVNWNLNFCLQYNQSRSTCWSGLTACMSVRGLTSLYSSDKRSQVYNHSKSHASLHFPQRDLKVCAAWVQHSPLWESSIGEVRGINDIHWLQIASKTMLTILFTGKV